VIRRAELEEHCYNPDLGTTLIIDYTATNKIHLLNKDHVLTRNVTKTTYLHKAIGDEMLILESYFGVRYEFHDSGIINKNFTIVSGTRYSLADTF
jgi:hypothetical protein